MGDRVVSTWLHKKPRDLAKTVSLVLLALLWLAFFLQLQSTTLKENSSASWRSVVENGEWYRLWTTLLVHGDVAHLVSNSFLFAVFSWLLIGYFSLWLFPMASVLLAGAMNLPLLKTYPADVQLIGASGLVYLMGGAWISLYILIATHRTRMGRSLRGAGVTLVLFMPKEFQPEVSERTHLLGLVLGLGLGAIWYALNRNHFNSAELREVEIDSPLEVEQEFARPERLSHALRDEFSNRPLGQLPLEAPALTIKEDPSRREGS
jgi:rhomboid protease GluP